MGALWWARVAVGRRQRRRVRSVSAVPVTGSSIGRWVRIAALMARGVHSMPQRALWGWGWGLGHAVNARSAYAVRMAR
jgi:hypothetical protein